MRKCTLCGLVAAVVVVGVCVVGAYALAQDEPKPSNGAAPADAAAQPAAAGTEDAMMQAWMQAATPGPHHQAMTPMAGKFKYVNKFKMDPSQEWVTTEGDYEGEIALDGRYLLSKVTGPMMGMNFTGMGCLGYDNMAKKHVAAWIDNMGTGIMRSEGTCDGSCKTITFEGEMLCPTESSPKMQPYKYQYEVKSNDEFVMRWWSPNPANGEMFESMVITYTRVQ